MKKWWIGFAEIVDALRLGPRVILMFYVYLVYFVVNWYMAYPLKDVVKCDSATLGVLLHNKVELEVARNIACQVTDVTSHPTGYTLLMSAVIGAAAIVFGLYSNTARRWVKDDKYNQYDSVYRFQDQVQYSGQNRSKLEPTRKPTNLNSAVSPDDLVG